MTDIIERLREENERLRGHIYASNRPQPEDIEYVADRLRLLAKNSTDNYLVDVLNELASKLEGEGEGEGGKP